jgi:uncharacterized cupin superfamily protein
MDKTEHKSFQAPDETREFPRGQLAIRMDDGAEFIARPGDVTALPSGHDAWVVGDEPVVTVDWFGAGTYAR